MTIHVSEKAKQSLLGGPENMVTELKTSIFFAPGETIPGVKQYYQIAKTIAGFVNGEGGVLWLGVDDDGQPKGVEGDLAVLGGGSARSCKGPLSNDEGMAFGGTADKYILKLKELVKAYLGPSAEKYIAGAQAATVAGKVIVKVPVSKADPGFVAYVYKWHPGEKRYTEEVYRRAANGTSHLEGFARDEFIRGKCREEIKKQLMSLQNNAGGLTKAELVAALKEIQETTVVGAPVQVEGAVVLDDPHFAALGSPKGFVFDGQHVCDVKGWKGAYQALLEKLNALDAATFDALPSEKDFAKWFVAVLPHKKYAGFSKTKFGSQSNIRAKELANKVYFINPDYIVHKLLARSNIEPSRVALRG